jgi:hypothetical protein
MLAVEVLVADVAVLPKAPTLQMSLLLELSRMLKQE